MKNKYTSERLSLFDALFKKHLEIASGRFWSLAPTALRFKHGESMAELKVPYHMGHEDEACIEDALLGLISLLMKRSGHSGVTHDAQGKKSTAHLPTLVPEVKDKTFRTDLFISDSLEKRITSAVLSSTPNIDSAVLSSWLSTDGHGKKFIDWVAEIFEKALLDEARHGKKERTSYLLLLAVIDTIRKMKDKTKGHRVKGLSYERLDLVTGMSVFTAFRYALADVLGRLKDARASCYTPQAEALLLSAVEPFSFLSIPTNLLSTSLNPYGINQETYDVLKPYAVELTAEVETTEKLVRDTYARLKGRKDVLAAIKELSDVTRFREESLGYLIEFNIPGSEVHATLYDLYNEDRLIKHFLLEENSCDNLSKALEEISKTHAKGPHRVNLITSFQDFLAGFKKKMFGGRRKADKRAVAETMEQVISSFLACRLDSHVEEQERLMRGYLADRRGEYKKNTLFEEYNKGRLYRFSRDERPILKTLEVEEEGQLFIDMKDFSRKTLKVKEIAMADFMKDYFYRPILSAAADYSVGKGVHVVESGIRLTNIPGDAAIFSGGVSNLVALAKDIQRIIWNSRDQLLKKLPRTDDEDILIEVHKRFEEKKALLKVKREELNEGLNRNERGIESKLVALGEEERRLEDVYHEEIKDAIGGELEAGLYISFGSKAETTIIEPKEGFSDTVKVAIGEKINEAARGTFRNPMVRAKLEVLLENEKQRRKNTDIEYPFDIYIDRIYSLKIPPELDSAFEKLISGKKASSAQAMAQLMANEYLGDLKRIVSGDAFSSLRHISCKTDIYNRGQALSDSALKAYMKESQGRKRFFQKTVDVHDLHSAIQEAFFFPMNPLEFCFGFEVIEGTEYVGAFYKSGEIVYKGFETNTPTVVYEMLNTEGKFFAALMAHHFHAWLEESKRERSVDQT